MMCAECHKLFTCRFCHDENCTHSIDRYAVEYMACMYCLRIQVSSFFAQERILIIRKLEKFVNTAKRSWESIIVIFAISGVMILVLHNSYP